ncbi:hypothetical protein [Dehalobacter sp. MCB1]|uniref:hypothetical protein n=1 Tax=Dehalobacter sp. MCB1 TaxID=1844756 RepID=UPI0013145056|nr:hypothetical protein [Dehalobacter sp. MCB1]
MIILQDTTLRGNFLQELSKGQKYRSNLINSNPYFNRYALYNNIENQKNKSPSQKKQSKPTHLGSFIIDNIQRMYSIFDDWLSETALKELKKSQKFFVKGHTKPLTILPQIMYEIATAKKEKGTLGFKDKLEIFGKVGLSSIFEGIFSSLVKQMIKQIPKILVGRLGTLGASLGFAGLLGSLAVNPLALAVISVVVGSIAATIIDNLLQKLFNSTGIGVVGQGKKNNTKQFAIGIPRVPYDNYPALLHEGESVLTKRETNNIRSGFGSVSIAKLSDTIIVREQADIDRVANALVGKIKMAAVNMA